MVVLRRRQRSSASASMAVESDPTRIPGKPFLEHLHRVLDTSDGDSDRGAGPALRSFRLSSTKKLLARQHEGRPTLSLAIEASCLCYLQQLFHAMLIPTTSPHSGLVTQWRLSASFAQQLEEDMDGAANMGVASPVKILQLAGRLLEVDTLYITNSASDATLPLPSDCDLAMLPNLSRLHLESVDLDTIRGLASVSESLTMKELRFSNKPIDSLAALLHTDDPPAKWRNLRSLCVDNARLSRVDSTGIVCVPNLESIVLTNNELEDLGALRQCDWLTAIDVSHNRIHSFDIASGVFEHVKLLNLSHNLITSIHSLCQLQLLEVLDLSHNLIHNFDEIQALAPLSRLHSLFLQGNPVSKLTKYRQTVRTLLSHEVLLDNTPWKAQDLEDLTRGSLPSSHGPKLVPTTAITESSQGENAVEFASFDKWWLARGVGSSCLVIGFAQLFVSILWSRDANAERLTLSIMGATAALSVVSVLGTLLASWLFRWWSLPPKCSEVEGIGDVSASSDKSSVQPLECPESSILAPLQSGARSISSDSVLSLDDFSAALDDAIRAGEDVTVSQLLSVCSHLQVCVAYWSHHETDGLGFAWLRLDRAVSTFNLSPSNVGSTELLRERLSSRMTLTLDTVQPSQSPATALAKLVPVIHLGAMVLSSVSLDGSLQQCLRDAYVQAFVSSHTWWRQRAVLALISPMPTTESFLEWMQSSHAFRDIHRFLTAVHGCGERLHLLHTCLVDLVDEHEHSFAHISQ